MNKHIWSRCYHFYSSCETTTAVAVQWKSLTVSIVFLHLESIDMDLYVVLRGLKLQGKMYNVLAFDVKMC
jgi:hypothetical protein